MIRVEGSDGERSVTPILRSTHDLASAIELQSLLSVVEVVLLEVDVEARDVVRSENGDVSLFALDETDYEARAGVNTDFVYHAEEVLADNFAILLVRRAGYDVSDLADRPDVLDALEAALEAR